MFGSDAKRNGGESSSPPRLESLEPRITVPDDVAAGARRALERMLEVPRAN